MAHWILILAVNSIEAITFYYIISRCLTLKLKAQLKYICIIGDFAAAASCCLLIDSMAVSICVNLLARVGMTFAFTNGSVLEKFSWGCLPSAIFLVSRSFVLFACKLIAGKDWDTIQHLIPFHYGISSIYIMCASILAFTALRSKKRELFYSIPTLALFILAALISILSMTTIMVDISRLRHATPDTDTTLISSLYFTWLSLGAVSILLFFLFASLGRQYKKNRSLMEINELQKLEQTQYESMEASNKALRAWKHDNADHLQTIAMLIEQQQYLACKQYIHELLKISDFDTPYIHTGNHIVDAILSAKKSEACNKGIDFTYELYLPRPSKMTLADIHMCSLLGNLMNNAIEACTSIQNPYIHLEIKMTQFEQMLITLENSSAGNYHYDSGNHLISTKKEHGHGIGLKQIIKIVENAGGILELLPKHDCFSVSILLPLKFENEVNI